MKRQGGELDLERFGLKAGDTAAQKNTASESGGKQLDLEGVSFTEDKYFARKMDKWNELADGERVKVGVIRENSALHRVGLPASGMYFDVGKIKNAMEDHSDHLTVAELKNIPYLLENPIVIVEYKGPDGDIKNTISVYGNLFFEGKPIVVGIVMHLDRSGRNLITNVRTIHARSNFAKQITDETVLYLNENKKMTRKWFHDCGNLNVPLAGTRFGVIRSIAYTNDSVKKNQSESSKKTYDLQDSLGKSLNPKTKARIAELESKLTISMSVPVYSNGDVTRYITKENGKYKLTDDPAKAIAVKPSEQSAVDAYVTSQYKKNPLRMIGTEQVAKPAKLSYAEKNLINAEISALRNGFETVTDAKAYDQKRKSERLKADKASVEGSYFEQAARKGEPFYVEQGGEIICSYQSAVRTIVSEAKRMGAEEVHTSAKRGSKFGSSVYLKMNGVEVRISDHHLPQTMERSDINYNQRWDDELVLTNGKML